MKPYLVVNLMLYDVLDVLQDCMYQQYVLWCIVQHAIQYLLDKILIQKDEHVIQMKIAVLEEEMGTTQQIRLLLSAAAAGDEMYVIGINLELRTSQL